MSLSALSLSARHCPVMARCLGVGSVLSTSHLFSVSLPFKGSKPHAFLFFLLVLCLLCSMLINPCCPLSWCYCPRPRWLSARLRESQPACCVGYRSDPRHRVHTSYRSQAYRGSESHR